VTGKEIRGRCLAKATTPRCFGTNREFLGQENPGKGDHTKGALRCWVKTCAGGRSYKKVLVKGSKKKTWLRGIRRSDRDCVHWRCKKERQKRPYDKTLHHGRTKNEGDGRAGPELNGGIIKASSNKKSRSRTVKKFNWTERGDGKNLNAVFAANADKEPPERAEAGTNMRHAEKKYGGYGPQFFPGRDRDGDHKRSEQANEADRGGQKY